MRTLGIVVALAALFPSVPRAEVSLGLRLGYAAAQGNVGGQLNMDEWVNGQVPVQLDGLVRVAPRLSIGAYGSYGFGRGGGDVKAICNQPGVSCALHLVRVGVQAVYELTPGTMAPWVAAGTGYEWNSSHFEGGGQAQDVTFHGLEWLNVQLGGDFKAAPSLAVGPYVMASVGQYDHGALGSSKRGGFGGEASERSIHAWAQVGIRARFDL
jgi:outer membrane protein